MPFCLFFSLTTMESKANLFCCPSNPTDWNSVCSPFYRRLPRKRANHEKRRLDSMRKLMLTSAALLLAAIPAYAQRDYPKAEVYGGYSYYSADINTNNPFSPTEREGAHG